MKITKVGSRGTMISFNDLNISEFNCSTNIYIINGINYVFLCDTYLGPDIMSEVFKYIRNEYGEKKIIVFNSHKHWDHIWGNCFFKDCIIISTKLCRDRIKIEAVKELETYKEFKRGEVEIILPNVTFVDNLIFEDEGIEFFYSPGHTQDSASCYDSIENVLFVGDNVEKPIPYLASSEISDYLSTLKKYNDIMPSIIIPGHGDTTNIKLVKEHINYLNDLIVGNDKIYFQNEYRQVHLTNLEAIKK